VRADLTGGVLLAGGASRRFGADKRALRTAEGATWLDASRRRLAAVADPVWVAVGAHDPATEDPWVVRDASPYQGPLAALIRLDLQGADRWVVTGVDQPRLPVALLRRLVDLSRVSGAWAVVPERAGQLEPLAAVYSDAGLRRLRSAYDAGARGFVRVLAEADGVLRLRPADIPADPESFASWFDDVDTDVDLARVGSDFKPEMPMSHESHWQDVYQSKTSDAVSWYTPHLTQSLAWIDAMALDRDAPIVDVGGGASTLVDDLIERGFSAVTVVDLSQAALDTARARLGARGDQAIWLSADATALPIPGASVAVWHDRAVLHFLHGPDRDAYIGQLRRAVRPGGHVVLATFAPDGPERCSGLPVQRYAPGALAALVGEGFEHVAEAREVHLTPWGSEQRFVYVWLRRSGGAG
jgi:molybdopterin-guanine dinucleotide biosynthesis protein A/SAM-dependent methyltransferase